MTDYLAWQWIVLAFQLVLAPLAVGHALLKKRDPRSALGWIGLIIVFPLVGAALYGLFGINRVRTRARLIRQQQGEEPDAACDVPPGSPLVKASLSELARISDAISDRPLVKGNAVEMLENGEAAYPAMLEAIDQARHCVFLMSYIMNADEVGHAFVEALSRAVKRGVEVKVLVDGMGELYSSRRISVLLNRAGVETVRFLPPRLFPPAIHLNLRNHRKVLVVDYNQGFAGGMNLARRHLTASGRRDATSDLHFRLRGPVAAQLYDVFAASWHFASGQSLPPPPSVPESFGDTICRTINDGPDEDLDKLAMVLVGAVSAARRRVQIMTPYFLPSKELSGALQAAALRGVQVQIILPQRSNLPFVDWATRKLLWELLRRGVQIFYQPAPFNHAKLFVVDEGYLLMGSANIDPRSLRLNFELGVEVYDAEVASQCADFMDAVRAASLPLAVDDLLNRSLPVKLRDSFFWLFTPYL